EEHTQIGGSQPVTRLAELLEILLYDPAEALQVDGKKESVEIDVRSLTPPFGGDLLDVTDVFGLLHRPDVRRIRRWTKPIVAEGPRHSCGFARGVVGGGGVGGG